MTRVWVASCFDTEEKNDSILSLVLMRGRSHVLQMAHLRHDYRFMPQVVSSAIWNCPPPAVLLRLLERTNKASKLNHNTQEKMVRDFDVRLPLCLHLDHL